MSELLANEGLPLRTRVKLNTNWKSDISDNFPEFQENLNLIVLNL